MKRTLQEELAAGLDVKEMEELVAKIRPILAHKGAITQGAVLADLTAIWLVGLPPQVRKEALTHHNQTIEQLIVANEDAIFGAHGHPDTGKS